MDVRSRATAALNFFLGAVLPELTSNHFVCWLANQHVGSASSIDKPLRRVGIFERKTTGGLLKICGCRVAAVDIFVIIIRLAECIQAGCCLSTMSGMNSVIFS